MLYDTILLKPLISQLLCALIQFSLLGMISNSTVGLMGLVKIWVSCVSIKWASIEGVLRGQTQSI